MPDRILSGALHYFRVRPEQWLDRLVKLKAMGLDTVETYVAWNLHEPRPGCFDFSGGLDVAGFVRLAGSLGLRVILRPGPYICAEWDMGGLPAWLLADPNMAVRCCYGRFLDAVGLYLDRLGEQLIPLLAVNGGPIFAIQIENEYGSFGADKAYLSWLTDALRSRGFDGLLFTSDQAHEEALHHGGLDGVWRAVNFDKQPREAFAEAKMFQPKAPRFCAELWVGWFDAWGGKHNVRKDAGRLFKNTVRSGASVNVYMFHGGTNFGFMNGANLDNRTGEYRPTVTSYDYNAPLDEAGEPTAKFHEFRDIIAAATGSPVAEPPAPAKRLTLGPIRFEGTASLLGSLETLSRPTFDVVPRPMEHLGQSHGFILYRTHVSHPPGKVTLTAQAVRDRAQVFIDGVELGVLHRNGPNAIEFEAPRDTFTIELLVENLGRVNYGPHILDRKGLLGWVMLGGVQLFHWEMRPLPLDDLSGLGFATERRVGGPTFFRARFEVGEPADLFLQITGGRKGVAWINGFNLGRYWDIGPQTSLYAPAPLLRAGANELTVLELHPDEASPVAHFRASR